MTDFRIRLTPERLTEGSPEERAAFGHLIVKSNETLLSEGFDNLVDLRRDGPLVSGYHLAEWLLWNWWRLRYEPHQSGSPSADWRRSHCMAEIGEGYVWPNITIVSDGYRSVIQSKPSEGGQNSSFRYYGAPYLVILPWSVVEHGIDDFVESVLARITESGLFDANLNQLWQELMFERQNPEVARYRRFEALLGADPDELSEEAIKSHLADALILGEAAVDELAAAAAEIGSVMTAAQVHESANMHGVEIRSDDAFTVDGIGSDLAPSEDRSAAEVGVSAARYVRKRAGLRHGMVNDQVLAQIAGVSPTLLKRSGQKLSMSFTLRDGAKGSRAVLRGKGSESRRFDLARLIGDRLIWKDAAMRPSTDTKTYRQKVQRAFAAEFLAPIDAVIDRAGGVYFDDRKEEIAQHFKVSPMVIDRILKNNRIIERNAEDFSDVA